VSGGGQKKGKIQRSRLTRDKQRHRNEKRMQAPKTPDEQPPTAASAKSKNRGIRIQTAWGAVIGPYEAASGEEDTDVDEAEVDPHILMLR
jgi:hypothetical protein